MAKSLLKGKLLIFRSNMKENKNISKYIIDSNGDVYSKDTGELLPMVNKTQYKLETDEVFKSSITGKKSNIVRRFTRDQIVKLYQDKESKKTKSK